MTLGMMRRGGTIKRRELSVSESRRTVMLNLYSTSRTQIHRDHSGCGGDAVKWWLDRPDSEFRDFTLWGVE